MPEAEAHAVAIVDDGSLSATGKLTAALDRAGFWTVLRLAQAARSPGDVRIVIEPELAGFAVGSPSITDPYLVEFLIDTLHDHGFTNVAVVGTADSSTLWAANRDLHALSDLLGYSYKTPRQRSYDVIDLADAQVKGIFPAESVLHGCAISRDWLDADFRIVFSKNRTDEIEGYALCLDTLIGVLPLIDKDLHYRKRRHAGETVAALIVSGAVDFCLIDAVVSGHGPGGRRAPVAADTHTIIAATDIVLADYAGALKMGLDPEVSSIFQRTIRTHPLPERYVVSGSLLPYDGWENVPPISLQAARRRHRSETLDRLVQPWLQHLDPELFPLKNPLDARLNATLADFVAGSKSNPTGPCLLNLANAMLGWIGATVQSYRTVFHKDALRRQAVPLGIDIGSVPESAFDSLVAELCQLELAASTAPQVSNDLTWLYAGEAIVFQYTRSLPIDFCEFVRHVDIARTIQFMNDYMGGVLVTLAEDDWGRPVRQAERNIYLPQPNYLVLYGGKPIDVSKLEVVDYARDSHRLYWKTILSDNGSATFDDGIATFARRGEGTQITIIGKQQFTLPPFWHVFDPNVVPGLKATLVTHAYQTFFDRTIANFEALVEGRDIHIGREVDEPAPPVMERLMPLLQRTAEILAPLVERVQGTNDYMTDGVACHVDSDGFVHVNPAQSDASNREQWIAEITRFFDGLAQAVQRDAVTPFLSI